MSIITKNVYKCYLGQTLGYRTSHILGLDDDSKNLIKKYATETDSVSDFMRKVDSMFLEA